RMDRSGRKLGVTREACRRAIREPFVNHRVIVACFGVLACLTAGAQEQKANDLPYTREENVVYHEIHGTGLLADIFVPTGNRNGLGIIDIVCGAWHSDRGKLRDHERAQVFNIFTQRGYVVFGMRPGSVTKYSGEELAANAK